MKKLSSVWSLHRDGIMEIDRRRASALCKAQGSFYLATGVWPLLSRRTFEAVTGPKIDFWLVRTVGVMFAVIGGTLILAGRRERVTPEIAGLGAATAAGFVALDTWYVSRGRIAPVYLLDAIVQAGLLASWRRSTSRRAPAAAAQREERTFPSSSDDEEVR